MTEKDYEYEPFHERQALELYLYPFDTYTFTEQKDNSLAHTAPCLFEALPLPNPNARHAWCVRLDSLFLSAVSRCNAHAEHGNTVPTIVQACLIVAAESDVRTQQDIEDRAPLNYLGGIAGQEGAS